MLSIRPFKEAEDNIIEILTDTIFLILIVFCFTLPHSENIGKNLFLDYSLKEDIMVSIVVFSIIIISFIGKNKQFMNIGFISMIIKQGLKVLKK